MICLEKFGKHSSTLSAAGMLFSIMRMATCSGFILHKQSEKDRTINEIFVVVLVVKKDIIKGGFQI